MSDCGKASFYIQLNVPSVEVIWMFIQENFFSYSIWCPKEENQGCETTGTCLNFLPIILFVCACTCMCFLFLISNGTYFGGLSQTHVLAHVCVTVEYWSRLLWLSQTCFFEKWKLYWCGWCCIKLLGVEVESFCKGILLPIVLFNPFKIHWYYLVFVWDNWHGKLAIPIFIR